MRVSPLVPSLLGWVHGQIRLHSPEALSNEVFNRQTKPGYIQGSTATFGAPYYGMRVMGRIVYASSLGNDYCTEDDYTLPESAAPVPTSSETTEEDHDTRRQINIVLIKRGESKCRFTTKVRVAEKFKNAQAVIIIDRERNAMKDVTKLIMSDENNFGSNIKIPSILINWHDGEKLVKEFENEKHVIADLQWDIPVNNVVTMDIWMSVISREAVEFLVAFKDAAEQLAYNLKVIPHYHIFSLPAGQTDYENMCTSRDGKFCSEDPDGGGPVTGKDVAIESARQLCIWEETAVKDPAHPQSGERRRSWKYWEYVTTYLFACTTHADEPSKRFGSEACSTTHMEAKGIDVDKVKQCLVETMDDKLQQQKNNLAWSKYAVRINGWRYAGAIEPEGITRAICAAYVSPVKECDALIRPYSTLAGMGTLAGGYMTTSSFITLLLIVMGGVGIGLYIYKKFYFTTYIQKALREEVMLEVQSQLADYVPLEERQGGGRRF